MYCILYYCITVRLEWISKRFKVFLEFDLYRDRVTKHFLTVMMNHWHIMFLNGNCESLMSESRVTVVSCGLNVYRQETTRLLVLILQPNLIMFDYQSNNRVLILFPLEFSLSLRFPISPEMKGNLPWRHRIYLILPWFTNISVLSLKTSRYFGDQR